MKSNEIIQVKGDSLNKYSILDGDYVVISDTKPKKCILCVSKNDRGLMAIVPYTSDQKPTQFIHGIIRNY